ncbi:hypothetical protein GCM10011390_10810 [Aureimonas endophytica]|uniref:histidine kinase n=1 Tax=Aureimonas endophytica TaxID=2027858 RepID=A0A916ZG34_9HYPH|nr:HAMP domain-containing sensor histidine kinase [Aureimonas endophytica]GGD93937.1 hypothetical protein GCM10011390_10810 [Aureimonas endophytica]
MGRARDRRGESIFPIQTLEAATIGRFEAIVAARIRGRTARRRQAVLLLALTGAGLAIALALPVAALFGAAMALVALPALVASLCLVLAAVLAATGAFEVVLGTAIAALSMLIALASLATGGLGSPLLWLLAVAPAECLLAGRAALTRVSLGIASFAACLVLGAEQVLPIGGQVPPSVALASAAAALLYLGLHGLRFRARQARRRRATEAEAMERRVVETMLGEAVLRFSPDGTLIHACEGAARIFGGESRDPRHPFLMACVHVADRVRYLSAFGEIRAGASHAACTVRVMAEDAPAFSEIALELTAIRDGAGRLASILLVVVRPSADERLAADALRRELDEARSLSEAKSNFLAMISHELRTPLNAIIGFSDILDQEFFGKLETPRQKEYVGLIRQSGEHLLCVVNGLLDVSKIEAGRYELMMESFAVDALFAEALAAMRDEAERKGLTLELDSACGDALVTADRRAVYQMLLNLLSNAVKFTDAGGVTLAARFDGAYLDIEMRDTGAGIAPADLTRLGKPFVQGSAGLARRHTGTGLGLSLVKGLAELHGGSMTIRSELGYGTSVLVRIRRDGTAAVPTATKDTTERVVALKHARTDDLPTAAGETRRSA